MAGAEKGEIVLIAAVLALLVLSAGTLDRTGVPGALVLVALCVLWMVVNEPAEGPLLADLGNQHGVTAADMASVAGVVVAADRLIRGWLRSRREKTRSRR